MTTKNERRTRQAFFRWEVAINFLYNVDDDDDDVDDDDCDYYHYYYYDDDDIFV